MVHFPLLGGTHGDELRIGWAFDHELGAGTQDHAFFPDIARWKNFRYGHSANGDKNGLSRVLTFFSVAMAFALNSDISMDSMERL